MAVLQRQLFWLMGCRASWPNHLFQMQAQQTGSLMQAESGVRSRERVIMHVDMDCFFAAVAAVGRPEFEGKPLIVCHSNSAKVLRSAAFSNASGRALLNYTSRLASSCSVGCIFAAQCMERAKRKEIVLVPSCSAT
jgi:hypothetical protein